MADYYLLTGTVPDSIQTKDTDKNMFINFTNILDIGFTGVIGIENLVVNNFLRFPLRFESFHLNNVAIYEKYYCKIGNVLIDIPMNETPSTSMYMYFGFTDYEIAPGTVFTDNSDFITKNNFVIPVIHKNSGNAYGTVIPYNRLIEFYKNTTYMNLFFRHLMTGIASGTDVAAIRAIINSRYPAGTVVTNIYKRYSITANLTRVK